MQIEQDIKRVEKVIHGHLTTVTVYPPQKYAKGGKEAVPSGVGCNGISWDYWAQPVTEAKATFAREQRAKAYKLANKRAVKLQVTQLYDEGHTIPEIMEATGKTEIYVRTVLFGYKPRYKAIDNCK